MASDQWHSGIAALPRGDVTYRRGGSGPALLYLHDAGADTVEATVFDDLRADHDVVMVNLPGYGGSDPPQNLTSATEIAQVLADLCRFLDLPPVLAAGTSLGGWFAAELALHRPELVASLLLSDAAGLHAPEDYLLALFAQGRAAAATQNVIGDALLDRLPLEEQNVEERHPLIAAAVSAPWVTNLAAAAAMSWHPYTVNPRLLARLPDIVCPTTVVWGECDALIPLEHARIFARRIPRARLVILPGVGHLPALEAPQAFAAEVRRLAMTDPARPGTVPG